MFAPIEEPPNEKFSVDLDQAMLVDIGRGRSILVR